jgi:hypothetical protein
MSQQKEESKGDSVLCKTLAGSNKELEASCNNTLKHFEELSQPTDADLEHTATQVGKLFGKTGRDIMELSAKMSEAEETVPEPAKTEEEPASPEPTTPPPEPPEEPAAAEPSEHTA